jgi:hypothetical protein
MDRRRNVAILADSRGFDTYFANDNYAEVYGIDRTYPFLLRSRFLSDPDCSLDVAHIPDHFRSGAIENNILRLALLDPAVVILHDGLWETLLTREHYLEYVTRRVSNFHLRDGRTLDLALNSETLVNLFVANELAIGPRVYADRIRRLVSYFARRRRPCVWINLTVPDATHLDRIHHAGNYRCLPEWERCLVAVNEAVSAAVTAYGAVVFDVDRLMRAEGGPARCLIDQWHFSPQFHARVAETLHGLVRDLARRAPASDHVSSQFMTGRIRRPASVALAGTAAALSAWDNTIPGITAVAWISERPEAPPLPGLAPRAEDEIADVDASVIVLVGGAAEQEATELRLIPRLAPHQIMVRAEEIGGIVNAATTKTGPA